jgi:hypothetical protein
MKYFTSLGKEHNREGMFKLIGRWGKCLNANGDYVKKINLAFLCALAVRVPGY